MKRLMIASLLAAALSGASNSATIWQEDFSSYIDAGISGAGISGGYPGSVTKWSIDVSACTLSDAADYFMAVDTGGGRMEAVDIDGEAIWTSELIDISAYTNVSLSVATSETGSSTSGSKYVRLFYKLNNGAETAFTVNPTNTGNWGSATATQSNLYGSTIQIIARVNNPNAGDASIFDNVLVSGDSTAVNLPPVLDAVGNKSVLELGTLSFAVTADDPIDHDPVTLSATNLPTGATFSTNGVFVWSNAAPAGIYSVTFYATDKDGSDSETISITVSERPKLLISEIADPAGTGGDVYRFVELYNAGTNAINLAAGGWTLSRQNNGGTTWSDIPLTGTVAAASTYLIAKSRDDFFTAFGFYPQQESTGVDGNGIDAFFLYLSGTHTNGTLIDVYGAPNTDGTGTAWEYTDSSVERKNTVLRPSSVWNGSEWIWHYSAGLNLMTPGAHGPRPVFQGLENQFVFLGNSLHLTVTAANPVLTNDVITLSTNALPAGATFATAVGTNTVSSMLNWSTPTAGVYNATFAAAGAAGTTTTSITITVSSRARIAGYFYGWSGDTIFKLDNGQFWQQSVTASKTVDPALYNPGMTISNVTGGTKRMIVTGFTNYYVVVEPLDVTESTVTNSFTGLRDGNFYQLADGTVWKQNQFLTVASSANPVTAWRWIKNGQQMMRFLDRNNVVIGTCVVIASVPPADDTVRSEIDGYFRGWQNKRIFALKNGTFWQQTSLDSSSQTLWSPSVTISNWFQTELRMNVAGATGTITVQQIAAVRTVIDGNFYGFGRGQIFKLLNGEWWKQTSLESSTSTRSNPEIILWSENGTDYLEMPDEGRRVAAEQLNKILESSVTNTFTGLHYGNRYRLGGGTDWIQVSFENVRTNVTAPEVMLWVDGTETNLTVRDSRDVTFGTCTVVDSNADSDNDTQSNAAEVLAGSDPLDGQSRFELRQTDRYILNWDSVEGRVYSIEWAPTLSDGFQTLENAIVWPQNCWTDTVHSVDSAGFYRITVRLAE